MNPEYARELRNALINVFETGFERVEWRRVYRWFDAGRLRNSVWDTFNTVFASIAEEAEDETGWRLGYLEWASDGDFLVLVCLDPASQDSSEVSFRPITDRKQTRKRRARPGKSKETPPSTP